MATLRTTAVAALAAATFVLTACGDKDDDPATTDASATDTAGDDGVEGAEALVRSFYEDFAAGDFDAACARWTADYAAETVEEWNQGDYGPRVSTCPEVLAEFIDVFSIAGKVTELLEVTDLSGELVDENTAHVDVALASGEGSTDTFELTLTDDGWLISGEVLADTTPSPTASP
jgi:hypothetical protein